ncbi:MAG: peroxiredoxin [Pseudomonadota bacterium]
MSSLTEPDWSTVAKPEDDGAADHLPGMNLADVVLPATDGREVRMADLNGRGVIYIYPRTGQPGVALPTGWDAIPGARGCTPQSCSFRDHYGELKTLGVSNLFGLSSQDTDYQKEAVDRLHLPFPLLSDEALKFAKAMRLPLFEADGMTLIKRMTLIIDDSTITHVFYPVFPPDRDAENVVAHLRAG